MLRVVCLAVVVVATGSALAAPVPVAVRTHAVRRTGDIAIDGHLDEPAWQTAKRETGFVQHMPKDGAKPSQDTSFAIIYDDEAIYVGVWCDDPHPELIRALLTRRDVDAPADAVMVGIDSYHDRRTAYVFQLNAAGVQRDMLMFDDQNTDDTWDAVWTGASAITDKGWTAEFRIPLNQLRFSANDTHEWGLAGAPKRRAHAGAERVVAMAALDARDREQVRRRRRHRSSQGDAASRAPAVRHRRRRCRADRRGRSVERSCLGASRDRARSQVRHRSVVHVVGDHQPRFRSGRSRSVADHARPVRAVLSGEATVLPRGRRSVQASDRPERRKCRRRVLQSPHRWRAAQRAGHVQLHQLADVDDDLRRDEADRQDTERMVGGRARCGDGPSRPRRSSTSTTCAPIPSSRR